MLSDDDAIAFSAILGGLPAAARPTVWWKSSSADPLELLAQAGAHPPGTPVTAQWTSFNLLAIIPDGGPLFTATVASGESGATAADTAGTWGMDSNGNLTLLFQTGDGIGNKTMKSFTVLSAVAGSTGVTRSFNSVGTVVWLATFTDNTTAIVAMEIS